MQPFTSFCCTFVIVVCAVMLMSQTRQKWHVGMTFLTNGRKHLLWLIGVEAGNGHHLGAAPWCAGHSRWGLLPKVSTESSVYWWRNEKRNKWPMKNSNEEESRERNMHYATETNYRNPISLDCNCVHCNYLLSWASVIKEKPNDLKYVSTVDSQVEREERLEQETEILSNQVVRDVWSSILVRRMIHISQNQGRVWNAITNWSCSSPGERCCLTLRFSIWTSAAHWFVCVSRGGLKFKVST